MFRLSTHSFPKSTEVSNRTAQPIQQLEVEHLAQFTLKLILIILVSVFLAPQVVHAQSGSFDPNAFYRLTTLWQGACKSLDIVNDGINNNQPKLAKTGLYSGQYWKISPVGAGYYRLTTWWQGTGKSLDIVNDGINNNEPILTNTGFYSGQYWKITPIGNEHYRLTTLWQGDGQSLDIVNDGKDNNKPRLANTGNYSGQYWRFTREKFVTTPPSSLNLNSFYKKYLDAEGIPVISSQHVPDTALYQVRFTALHMLSRIPNVREKMIQNGARIAVMADTEVTTDIPEHAYLTPKAFWDERARGLGGTVQVPTASCAEENLLCYDNDKYRGEDIFIHEFTHSIHLLGLVFAYPNFQNDLNAAFQNAKANRLWANTYAMSPDKKNQQLATEYFAEGVQSWFNVNQEAIPTDSVHNHVDTRSELQTYDPMLYNLIRRYFPTDDNACSCQ